MEEARGVEALWEVVEVALAAYVGSLSPRKRLAFLHSMAAKLEVLADQPAPIRAKGLAEARKEALEWFRSRVAGMLE